MWHAHYLKTIEDRFFSCRLYKADHGVAMAFSAETKDMARGDKRAVLRRRADNTMKSRVTICMIGMLLLWSGLGYGDPGGPAILGKTNMLDMTWGLMGSRVSRINVTMAGNTLSYDFSPWRGGQDNDAYLRMDSLDPMSGDGDRGFPQFRFAGLASPRGIRWGNPLGKRQKWAFAIEMGVAMEIPPEMGMTAAGRLVLNAPFEDLLIRGEKQLGEQLDDFGYFPVVTFCLRYRF
jgi:hypothetical protein